MSKHKTHPWNKCRRGRYDFSRASGEWHLKRNTIVPIYMSEWKLIDHAWHDVDGTKCKFRHFYGEMPEKYTIIDVWEGFDQ